MPRLARTVFASLPHHSTQEGNRREDVFFDDEDRQAYLKWLGEYGVAYGAEVAGHCLMTNHIHLISLLLRMLLPGLRPAASLIQHPRIDAAQFCCAIKIPVPQEMPPLASHDSCLLPT